MVTTTKRIAATLFGALMFSASAGMAAEQPSSGKTYKWVDEKGGVHYSDKAPIEATNREQAILDRQARQVKKIEATSPEKLQKISDEEAERLRLEQAQKDIAERKDRALLLSYLNEKDIELARDRALSSLDAQIDATKVILTQQQTRRKELLARQETGGVLPEGELENLENEITTRNMSIERGLREKEKLFAKYERDKLRWRELKNAEKARIEAEREAEKTAGKK